MPAHPNDLLDVAKSLISFSSEASYRASVSRSYYAVHHYASITISKKNPIADALFFEGSSHQKVHKKLLHGGTLQWRALAYKVSEFKKERVEADYFLDTEITASNASDAILKAKALINELNEL